MNSIYPNNSIPITNSLHLISLIESAYDRLDREVFEKNTQSKSNSLDSKLWMLYLNLWDRNLDLVFSEAESLLSIGLENDTKAFVIQAAIAACEILYDLKLRSHWMKKWHLLLRLPEFSYSYHIFLYQKGNDHFFNDNIIEAIKLWQKSLDIAKSIKYQRGIYRLIFFIGRAQHDQGFSGSAKVFYEDALLLAKQVDAHRIIERIKTQQQALSLENNYLFNSMQVSVYQYLKSGQIKKAKRSVLYYCRVRRIEKRSWGSQSEWILLGLVTYLEGKLSRFFKIVDAIDSDEIKRRVLNLAKSLNSGLADNSTQFKQYLTLYISSLGHDEPSQSPFVMINENNSSKEFTETNTLLEILKSNPSGVTKEQLCKKIWNFNYDPIIHDQRVYALIAKTRKYMGSKNSIIHSYRGYYRLNPILIFSAQ
jgi:hypothetical protein